MCIYTVMISHPGLPHCTIAGGGITSSSMSIVSLRNLELSDRGRPHVLRFQVCWVITVAAFPWYPTPPLHGQCTQPSVHTLPWQLPPSQATREMPTSLSPLFLIHESVRTVEKYVCLYFEDGSYH